ncbi:MAG TPA: rhombosortase [Thermoanaerobaculia bacterium]|nr:rhombosortase [Thermoanaerobaculia bacterium]
MKRFPWLTTMLVALCAAASLGDLEYDRARVEAGEVWRLLTGQMVHWTARMAVFDLGMLLGLGMWLEARGDRRLAAVSLALGAVLTAVAVHLSPDLLVYRGSSGVASTLFVLAAFRVADSPDPWTRALSMAAVALFLSKAAFESLAGQTLFAGDLPEGVRVVPLVHLMGGLAGAAHLAKRSGPEVRTLASAVRCRRARARSGSTGRRC